MNGMYMSLTAPSVRFAKQRSAAKLSKSDPTNLYRHRALSNLSNDFLLESWVLYNLVWYFHFQYKLIAAYHVEAECLFKLSDVIFPVGMMV